MSNDFNANDIRTIHDHRARISDARKLREARRKSSILYIVAAVLFRFGMEAYLYMS